MVNVKLIGLPAELTLDLTDLAHRNSRGPSEALAAGVFFAPASKDMALIGRHPFQNISFTVNSAYTHTPARHRRQLLRAKTNAPLILMAIPRNFFRATRRGATIETLGALIRDFPTTLRD